MLQIKVFQFSPIQENTYIIYNEFNDCVIFDPGCYFDEEKEMLAQFIKNNSLQPKMLINTHCHLDHVFGNKYVSEKYQLTPMIHSLEKQVLEYAPVSGLMYNLPFEHYTGDLNYIEGGQLIKLGNETLECLFTPGHSPGSLSFYSKSNEFIISGDVLFKRSVGRTDLPGGNYDLLINTIKSKLFILPDTTTVYSGHGETTTIGEEKLENPYLV
jgi:glyoxylase-like metal-dependent hydrolase (beta-lactamase superfamily II)